MTRDERERIPTREEFTQAWAETRRGTPEEGAAVFDALMCLTLADLTAWNEAFNERTSQESEIDDPDIDRDGPPIELGGGVAFDGRWRPVDEDEPAASQPPA